MAFIQAKYFGPTFAPGEPRQIVIHSVESDLIEYLGEELAKGWFQNPGNETSAHTITDPAVNTDMVNEIYRAWHCGNGNSTSLGDEHTGRAAFTREQWTTDLGMKMLRLSAKRVAKQCHDHNIRPRWLSLTQLANNEDGLCTHNDMRLIRGGTDHHDPGPGFPYDLFLQMVNEEYGNVPRDDGSSETPTPPMEDDDVVTPQDKQDIINGVVAALNNQTFTASDAYDAEIAKRQNKPYTAQSLKRQAFFEQLYNRASMSARDSYGLRNWPDAASKIVDQVKAMLKDKSDSGVLQQWRLSFAALFPTGWDRSYAQMIVSTFQKVTGTAKPVTTGTATAQTGADTDDTA